MAITVSCETHRTKQFAATSHWTSLNSVVGHFIDFSEVGQAISSFALRLIKFA